MFQYYLFAPVFPSVTHFRNSQTGRTAALFIFAATPFYFEDHVICKKDQIIFLMVKNKIILNISYDQLNSKMHSTNATYL